MGWRDRDWAKWTDEESRAFYGSGGSSAPSPSFPARSRVRPRPTNSVLLAVIVSFIVALALGQLPHSHPLIPALRFALPSLSHRSTASRTGTISLPHSLPLSSFLTIHGRLAVGEAGTVEVEGAYVRPPWKRLAAVPAPAGSYEARIRLDHKGLLHLRVIYPDGHRAVDEVRVR